MVRFQNRGKRSPIVETRGMKLRKNKLKSKRKYVRRKKSSSQSSYIYTYALEHKYPWDNKWIVVVTGDKIDSRFVKQIVDEPLHIVEMEYRLIKNSNGKSQEIEMDELLQKRKALLLEQKRKKRSEAKRK